MAKNVDSTKKNRNKTKSEPAVYNDQLGENAGEGRITRENKKEKKR